MPSRGCKDIVPTRRGILTVAVTVALPVLTGCTAVVRGDREETLIERYGTGIASFNDGADRHNDGVVEYRSDEYTKATTVLGEARSSLTEAHEAFLEAKRLATESGNPDAERICSEAVAKTETLLEATILLRDSARWFADGDYEQAQSAYDQYQEKYALVGENRIRDQQVVADAVDDISIV